ncbi:MAG: glycosyltransferase family 4 protein [Lachnospiraceae bacterium]|nr:glycosyltransferase family 4 protein [Lachnospiraceae bacterium]
MRILWLCNIMLPAIAEKLHKEYSVREGWLTGTFRRLTEEEPQDQIALAVCFPVSEEWKEFHQTLDFPKRKVECYGFEEDLSHPEKYDQSMEIRLAEIIRDFKPDIVHIFGTEFPHALAMTKAFPHPEKILVGLQGIIGDCAKVYQAGLPAKVVNRRTFRDLLKQDGILQQQEKFRKRGEFEKQTIAFAGNVTGRTSFDKEAAYQMNPDVTYYAMNETMRPCFYTDKWEKEYCRAHRIFVSQADYPLKGFHFLLKALPKIKLHYPDTEVVVAGNSIVRYQSLKDKIKISSYGKYLRSYMEEWELDKTITFTGPLSAEEMKEQYLSCNTFVCPSVLENSPNSVAEARLLGVPVVASNVGGIPSMITDREDGLLFASGDSEQLADCITELWGNDALSVKISDAARARAHKMHDADENYSRLLEIYREILEKGTACDENYHDQ